METKRVNFNLSQKAYQRLCLLQGSYSQLLGFEIDLTQTLHIAIGQAYRIPEITFENLEGDKDDGNQKERP